MTASPPLLRRTARLAAAALVLAAGVAAADDIDIYSMPGGATERPNVLIVLDSSANWSSAIGRGCTLIDDPSYRPGNQERGSKMAIEKCALYNLFHTLPVAADGSALFNVGLMLFNESPAAHSGAYPRKAFTPLTEANRAELKRIVRDLDATGDKGNNAAFAKAMHEAFLMFSGAAPYKGTAGTKWDRAAVSGGRYLSPGVEGCARNFLIFIANGGPGEVTDNEAKALLAGLGGNTTPIAYPSAYVRNADQSNWADEYARFMNGVDVSTGEGRQNVVTHAIAVTGASSDGLYPNFVRAMANQGGGSFYEASDADALANALREIFNQIQAVDSVFSSVSLPLSASRQGTFQNQVFVGIFRPDVNAGPRWMGNLKQYKVAFDVATDALQLVDGDGRAAISAATGFLNPNARSFWSEPNAFWINRPSGTPLSASDAPDGEVAEKGGAGQRLRTTYAQSQDARRVYTCVGCSGGARLADHPFARSNGDVSAARLGVDASRRDALIDWVRGAENVGDERGPGAPTTVRPSIHGDVLHSRPVVLDYGGETGTVVFYGTNDGLLRAVRGTPTGTGAGEELWSFVAPEFFPKLARQRADAPSVRFPGTPSLVVAEPRDYFFDGPIGVYRDSAAGRTILYPTMRRGGRAIYAIEVTDPANPRFLWKLADTDASVLGQSWSEPKAAKLRGHAGPVLILGAGYDAAAEDVDPPVATTRGNAVIVLDALTGAVLRQLGPTERSVAADVALVDLDYDGYVDRAYAADVGGNVYRVDFESSEGPQGPGGWTLSTLARLGDPAFPRKFFFAPDVVPTRSYVGVLLGSGDREKPLKAVGLDRFYVLKDPNVAKGPPPAGWTPTADEALRASGAPEGATERGCYVTLASGEKVVTGAATIAGTTYFSTNRPTPSSPLSCRANLGEARAYELPLFCGRAASQVLTGGGLPPTPVVGLLQVAAPGAAGGGATRVVPFVIGGINTKKSALEIKKVNPVVPVKRRRPYWYIEADR
ncbi:MAG TPA: PilC/PilY family type IV pilus protein [Burkholderiaceae bacterium]|nr:PilC/PilY family type IV pilus protein [Burkholderiaceae bacterium]